MRAFVIVFSKQKLNITFFKKQATFPNIGETQIFQKNVVSSLFIHYGPLSEWKSYEKTKRLWEKNSNRSTGSQTVEWTEGHTDGGSDKSESTGSLQGSKILDFHIVNSNGSRTWIDIVLVSSSYLILMVSFYTP